MSRLINPKNVTLVLGVSACGLMGYFLYLLLKNDDDEYIETIPVSSNHKRIEMKIPKNFIKVIIGRNGQKIKEIQEKSKTKMNFSEKGSNAEFKNLIIRGSADACHFAEILIQELLSNEVQVESIEMWVPSASVGRIIGRCGENITEITSTSGAKVVVVDEKGNSPNRKLIIKGTKDQINTAKTLIQEMIEKSVLSKSFIDSSLAKREPRLPPKSLDVAKSGKPKVEDIQSPDILGQSDNQFEVYISAMIDPSHFWLQIVGPKATELDQLVEEMSEYYSKDENKELHKLNSVQKGDLVAAIFKYDEKWYRAEVLNVITNDPEDVQAELYYVDYGDTDCMPTKNLYELRTDFLRLHFQAIECFLARVEPAGETWSDEAVDKFEEWTHVAQWKKLSAKVNGYCVREKTRAKREGSPIPGVDLFDVSNEQDVNIAKELVDHGYAVFKKESDIHTTTSRTESSTSVNSIS